MANNDGFIDAIEDAAYEKAVKYNNIVLTMIGNIDTLNKKQAQAKTPSQSDAANAGLLKQIKDQEAAVSKLQGAYAKLSEEQKKKAAGNVQERVDNSILLQQEKQQATIISEVAGAYRKLSAEQAKSATNVQNIIARGRLASQTQRQFNTELRIAQKEFDGLNKRVLAADAAVGKFNRNVGNYPKILGATNQLLGALGISLGATGAVALAKNIFETTKQLQSLDLALKSVTGSEEQFAIEQQFLRSISEEYGLEIKNLTSLYTAFYVAAKDKLAGREIQQIFEDIAKSGSALGLSNDALQRSFTAINQMLSKGTIQSEELRGQLAEALPGSVQALLRAVQKLNPEIKNLTEKGLFQMIKDGKILANEVLPEMSKQLLIVTGADKAAGIDTLTKSTNRLQNLWTDFVRTLNESESGGVTQFFNFFIDAASKALAVIIQLNKGMKALRDEAAGSSKESVSSFLGTVEDEKERAELAKITRADALKWIETYNEQLKRANHEFELYNEVSILNFTPERQSMRKAARAEQERLNLALGIQRGRLMAANEVLGENNKIVAKNTELTKAQLKAIEDALKSRYELEMSNLERSKFIITQNLKDEDNSRKEKIKLQKELAFTEVAIATRKYTELLRLSKGNLDKMKIAANEYITAIESIAQADLAFPDMEQGDIETPSILPAISDKERKKIAAQLKEVYDEAYGYKDFLEKQHAGYSEVLTKQQQATLKGLLSDYAAALEAGDDETAESIRLNIDLLNQYGNAIKEFNNSFISEAFSGAGLSTLFSIMNDEIAGFGENATTTALAVTEAFQEMYNKLSEFNSENFDQQYKRLEAEKNIAIMFAGESDAAKKQIEKQYEARKRIIQERELKAQKEIARFNVIINTAQAVVSALATTPFLAGIALAAVAAAAGAVQLAAINAQQIPQYFKGTENAPSGWAWTQELGAEAIFDKNDRLKTKGSNKGAQLTLLEKGDKVKTAAMTALMFDNRLNNVLNERGVSMGQPANKSVTIDNSQVVAEIRNLTQAVTNRPTEMATFDRLGMSIFTTKNGARTKHVSNRLRIRRNG